MPSLEDATKKPDLDGYNQQLSTQKSQQAAVPPSSVPQTEVDTFIRCPLPSIRTTNPDSLSQFTNPNIPQYRVFPPPDPQSLNAGIGTTSTATASISSKSTQTISFKLVPVSFSQNLVFDATGVNGPVTFSVTLINNVISASLLNVNPGQLVIFAISQPPSGGFTFVWPPNILVPSDVSKTGSVTTVQTFVVISPTLALPIANAIYTG